MIEEGVTAYRNMAGARPEAFLPGLAVSLNNQSSRLGNLGRREEALAAIEEAVTIRRRLTHARPAEFAERLASSLKRQAAILSALGRDAEAKAARDEADRRDTRCRGSNPLKAGEAVPQTALIPLATRHYTSGLLNFATHSPEDS